MKPLDTIFRVITIMEVILTLILQPRKMSLGRGEYTNDIRYIPSRDRSCLLTDRNDIVARILNKRPMGDNPIDQGFMKN